MGEPRGRPGPKDPNDWYDWARRMFFSDPAPPAEPTPTVHFNCRCNIRGASHREILEAYRAAQVGRVHTAPPMIRDYSRCLEGVPWGNNLIGDPPDSEVREALAVLVVCWEADRDRETGGT